MVLDIVREDTMDGLFAKLFIILVLFGVCGCSAKSIIQEPSPATEQHKHEQIKKSTTNPTLVKVTQNNVTYNPPHPEGIIPQECCYYPIGFRYLGR